MLASVWRCSAVHSCIQKLTLLDMMCEAQNKNAWWAAKYKVWVWCTWAVVMGNISTHAVCPSHFSVCTQTVGQGRGLLLEEGMPVFVSQKYELNAWVGAVSRMAQMRSKTLENN